MSDLHPHHHSPQPRHVGVTAGLDWLATGWRLFAARPGIWIAQTVILVVILAALIVVPLIGWAAAPVAFPLLAAGMISGADRLDRAGQLEVLDLFDGLRRHAPNLILVGLFYLAGGLLAGLIAAAIGGSAALTGYLVGALAGFGLAIVGGALASAVFSVLWIALIMAMWFAPALVLLRGVAPFDAMKASVRACLHSPLAFLTLAAMLYVLAWLAMLPAGLGVLVLAPVTAGAMLAAYREVFGSTPEQLPALLAPEQSATQAPPTEPPNA